MSRFAVEWMPAPRAVNMSLIAMIVSAPRTMDVQVSFAPVLLVVVPASGSVYVLLAAFCRHLLPSLSMTRACTTPESAT